MANKRPDGDGLVRKRSDGRWEGRIVYGMLYNTIYAIQNKIRKGQGSVYESCPFVSDIQKSS